MYVIIYRCQTSMITKNIVGLLKIKAYQRAIERKNIRNQAEIKSHDEKFSKRQKF